jgi:hypothetical protein
MPYQWRITPATIKKLVIMYINTIAVRMQAIRSASASDLPAFSPNALAQIRQILRINNPSLSAIVCIQ